MAVLAYPLGVCRDGFGGYYIADSGNVIIRHVIPSSATATQTPSQSASQAATVTQSSTPGLMPRTIQRVAGSGSAGCGGVGGPVSHCTPAVYNVT